MAIWTISFVIRKIVPNAASSRSAPRPDSAIRPSLAESLSPRMVLAFGGPGRPHHPIVDDLVAERGSRRTRRPVAGLARSLRREPARRSGFRGRLGPLASPRSLPRSVTFPPVAPHNSSAASSRQPLMSSAILSIKRTSCSQMPGAARRRGLANACSPNTL